jgi:hypothetical protein
MKPYPSQKELRGYAHGSYNKMRAKKDIWTNIYNFLTVSKAATKNRFKVLLTNLHRCWESATYNEPVRTSNRIVQHEKYLILPLSVVSWRGKRGN